VTVTAAAVAVVACLLYSRQYIYILYVYRVVASKVDSRTQAGGSHRGMPLQCHADVHADTHNVPTCLCLEWHSVVVVAGRAAVVVAVRGNGW
jgi:hypothetical protein